LVSFGRSAVKAPVLGCDQRDQLGGSTPRAAILPWYGVSFLGISAEVDGLAGHAYLYIVLVLCLAIIGYLIAAAGFEELPVQLPLSHRQRLLAGTGVNAVLVLLAFLIKPGAAGWRFGAVSGIIAAVFATAALVIPAAQARKASA
jgi:hypothetical protein